MEGKRNIFDYVIVGCGSAGSILARRLSESGKYTVCALERGSSMERFPDQSWIVQHTWTGLVVQTMETPFSLPYFTEPQKHCNNRRIFTPRGITLGGSGAINGTMWVRGHPLDYDRWAHEEGCTGWSFEECLPYFKRLETYESGISLDAQSLPGGLDEVIQQDQKYAREQLEKYRGNSGPIHTISGRVANERYSRQPMAAAVIRAAMQAGFPYCPDQNGPSSEGIGWADSNVHE